MAAMPSVHVAPLSLRFAIALLVLTGCSRERAAPPAPRASLITEARSTTTESASARWRYHPPAAARLLSRVELTDDQRLYAGRRGERWLVSGGEPVAHPAWDLAPEDLIAALRVESGFLFVGRSGTAYKSREPLGPFVRSSAPLDPLVRVSAAAESVVGIRRDGSLLLSEHAGASWSPVGPDGVEFSDVALSSDGSGLGLAVPESYWVTRDRGRTWARLDVPTTGAARLVRDEDAGIVVESAFGPRTIDLESDPPWRALGRSVELAQFELGARVPLGPSAGALRSGRAVISAGRYFEARSEPDAEKWRLLHGRLDVDLDERPLPIAAGCRSVKLAAFGETLYLACNRQTATAKTNPIELAVSDDGGETWKPEPYRVMGRFGELVMAAGAEGSLLLSGVCPAHDAESGCQPAGLQRRRSIPGDGGEPRAELGPAATPALVGTAFAVAFGPEGRRAAAVGVRSKGRALVEYLSDDRGETFAAHEVPAILVPEDDDRPTRPEAFDVESLVLSGDGSVSALVRRYRDLVLVVTDGQGSLIALSKPPAKNVLVGAAGRRALALSTGSHEAWESLDGGTTWESLGGLGLKLCPEDPDCQEAVVCHPEGCIVGDLFSRLGWRADRRRRPVLGPPEQRGVRVHEPRVRTPISCVLGDEAWASLPPRSTLPSADQAAIGDTDWFSLSHDPDSASVVVLHGRGGRRPKVTRVVLLSPARDAGRFAYAPSLQVEGAAAVRYRVPRGRGDTSLSNVEVAWDNLLERHVGRARLVDGGSYRPGDFEKSGGRAQYAKPALLSIASGGIYLRLHAALGDRQVTHFLDGRRTEAVPAVDWPDPVEREGRSEMAHIGTEHVPLRLDDATLVRAIRRGGGWRFDAVTVGWPRPKDFGIEQYFDIAYAGERSGVHLTIAAAARGGTHGWLYPFGAESTEVVGAAVAVPTQRDLEETPAVCSRAQRDTTPRAVAPYHPGTRHPVLVTDAIEPMRTFLTSSAVLHGDPSMACAAAFDAEIVSSTVSEETPKERVVLLLDDLDHAWLFRLVEPDGEQAHIEYRTMSCRFDPGVEVPAEVFRERGTIVSH